MRVAFALSCLAVCSCLRQENAYFGRNLDDDATGGEDCRAGTLDCECSTAGTCSSELICVEGVCHEDPNTGDGSGEGDDDDDNDGVLPTEPCADEPSFSSPQTEVLGEIEWANEAAGPRDVYWLTHDGGRQRRWSLDPGDSGPTEVSRDHYFLIADAGDACLTIYRITQAGITVRLTE